MITWHGIGHLVAAGRIGFLGLIIACLAYARRRSGPVGAARRLLLVTGVTIDQLRRIASGAGNAMINIAFTVAVALGWDLAHLAVPGRAEEGQRA